MKDKEFKDLKIGEFVRYGEAGIFEVADKTTPDYGGWMVGIYDEPPSKHIDYLNAGNCEVVNAIQVLNSDAKKWLKEYIQLNGGPIHTTEILRVMTEFAKAVNNAQSQELEALREEIKDSYEHGLIPWKNPERYPQHTKILKP